MIYKQQPQKFLYLSIVYRRLLTFETNHVNLEKEKVKDLLATTTVNYAMFIERTRGSDV